MKGWGKVLTGVLLGVAGTVYATNEEVRRRLPGAARDLPEILRRRFQSAVAAAREASESRREEILRELRAREEASGRVSPNGGGASARDGEGR